MTARPSQHPWTIQELEALPVKVDIPTAASILGMGQRKLRELFNETGDRTVTVEVGDKKFVIAGMKRGRQLWVVTEGLRRIFDARGP